MDPICHTLVGVTLAQAGLKSRTPLAAPTLIIGANLADIDALAYLAGESLFWRRGWTHGVLSLAVWPFVLTAVMLAWDYARRHRNPDRRAARAPSLLLLSAIAI